MLRLLLTLVLAPLAVIGLWLAAGRAEPRADFVVASDQIRTLDPHRLSFMDEVQIAGALYEGLTRLNSTTYQPEPAVAERWEISPDALTYTFHLRPDARWSNGRPVEADHFHTAWLRVLDPQNQSQYASLLFTIAGAEAYYRARTGGAGPSGSVADAPAEAVGIEVPDARTLRVRLAYVCPYFLELCAFPTFAPIYPPLMHAVAYRDGRVLTATRHLLTRPGHIVCNGPFVLARWDFKQRLLLTRNEHYWDSAGIAVDTLEVYLAGTGNPALIAYETGRVDLVRGLEPETARKLLEDQQRGRRRDVHISDRFATFFLRINCRRPPFDNADLRKALSLAIDREQICLHILGLGETPAETYVPRPAIPLLVQTAGDGRRVHYEPPDGLGAGLSAAQRAELAREYLARSGAAEVLALRPIELAIAPEPVQYRLVAEAVREMWRRELGVPVVLQTIETRVLSERIRNLDYDIVRSNWFGDFLDPISFLEMFTSSSGQNRTGWSSGAYDRLIEAAFRERDPQRRFELLSEAEGILCREGLPIVPLYYMTGNYLLNPRFSGLVDHVRGVLPVHRVRPADDG